MKIMTQQFEHNANLLFSIMQIGKRKPLYQWTAFNTDENHEIAQEVQRDFNKESGVKVLLEIEPVLTC